MPKLDFSTMKPREIEAYLRQRILHLFGDSVENASKVTSSHGYYHVVLQFGKRKSVFFDSFRKTEVPEIARTLKVLADGPDRYV